MTLTIRPRPHHTSSLLGKGLIAAAVAATIGATAVTGISVINNHRTANPTRTLAASTIVDPTGLGAALSVTYPAAYSPTLAASTIVDPTGLGAALSVTYPAAYSPTLAASTIVDPTGLGAALSVTYPAAYSPTRG